MFESEKKKVEREREIQRGIDEEKLKGRERKRKTKGGREIKKEREMKETSGQ